jgi:hypothetical protein
MRADVRCGIVRWVLEIVGTQRSRLDTAGYPAYVLIVTRTDHTILRRRFPDMPNGVVGSFFQQMTILAAGRIDIGCLV